MILKIIKINLDQINIFKTCHSFPKYKSTHTKYFIISNLKVWLFLSHSHSTIQYRQNYSTNLLNPPQQIIFLLIFDNIGVIFDFILTCISHFLCLHRQQSSRRSLYLFFSKNKGF